MRNHSEVVILGAGMAGLTLALQLRQRMPEVSVCVVDRRKHPAPEAAFKVGESMVEVSSWYLREVLGLGNHLLESHLPKFGLRFFMSDGDNSDLSRRPEYGLLNIPENVPNLSYEAFRGVHLGTYNIDRGRLENHLVEQCREAGAQILDDCKVHAVNLGDPHEIFVQSAGREATLSARWVIDATGRSGTLANNLKLRQQEDHQLNAAWFRLRGRVDPDQWTQDVAFHQRTFPDLRWLSTNHLMGPGYWIWLIPLPDGATSVGIMTDPAQHPISNIDRFERALTWLQEREPQLADVIASLDRLDFSVLKAQSYRSKRTFSTNRWALCGESAFFVDALYSPGGDFIAVGNTLITQMIAADYNGDRLQLSILANFGEQLLRGMFQHYLGLYKGSYCLMGKPDIMLQKVAWDTAVYFAYNVLLFCNGRFCDPDFHRMIRQENTQLERLQKRMRYQLKNNVTAHSALSGRFIDQARIDPIQSLYRSSNGYLDTHALKTQLSENLEILEHFGNNIGVLLS